LLLLPFATLAAAVVWIDPFDFFGISKAIPAQAKKSAAWALNPCIGKLSEFRRDPSPNILLGDSRMESLDADRVTLAAGERYRNLSYGGASIREIADTFWLADSLVPLKNVYIGLGFNLYSDYNVTYRTDSVKAMFENPLLYFTNRTVLKSSYLAARAAWTGADPRLGAPTEDKETFWNSVLATYSEWYGRYTEPVRYRKELEKIAAHCRAKGARLRFVVFPGHNDVRALVGRRKLDSAYAVFKSDLQKLAPTYDYDVPSEITSSRDNYRDPVHFNGRIRDLLIDDIWKNGGALAAHSAAISGPTSRP
jgi:hypothetical protein